MFKVCAGDCFMSKRIGNTEGCSMAPQGAGYLLLLIKANLSGFRLKQRTRQPVLLISTIKAPE
jgi:hypothetical protein